MLDGSTEARCSQMVSLTFLANNVGCWLIDPRAGIICLCHTYPLFFQTVNPGFFTRNTSSNDGGSIPKGQKQKLQTSWNWSLQDAQCHLWHIQAKAITGPVPIPGIPDIANWWKKQQTHCNGSLYQDVRNCWDHHKLYTKASTLFFSISLSYSLHLLPLFLSFPLSLSLSSTHFVLDSLSFDKLDAICLTKVHLRPVSAECKKSLKSLTLHSTKFSLYKVDSFSTFTTQSFIYYPFSISLFIISHICIIHGSPPIKRVNSKLSPNNCQKPGSQVGEFSLISLTFCKKIETSD